MRLNNSLSLLNSKMVRGPKISQAARGPEQPGEGWVQVVMLMGLSVGAG